MTVKGDWAVRFTPTGGSESTHTLQYPVTDLRPAHRKRRYAVQPVTRDHHFVHTPSTKGVDEMTVSIRLANQPGSLLDLLEAAADGARVVLDTDTTEGSTSTNFPSHVIGVGEQQRIEPDRDRFTFAGKGEYEVTMTLRHEGDGDYDAIVTT